MDCFGLLYVVPVGEFEEKKTDEMLTTNTKFEEQMGKKKKGKMGKRGGMELLQEIFRIQYVIRFWLK